MDRVHGAGRGPRMASSASGIQGGKCRDLSIGRIGAEFNTGDLIDKTA